MGERVLNIPVTDFVFKGNDLYTHTQTHTIRTRKQVQILRNQEKPEEAGSSLKKINVFATVVQFIGGT